jgi:hypothetical protein
MLQQVVHILTAILRWLKTRSRITYINPAVSGGGTTSERRERGEIERERERERERAVGRASRDSASGKLLHPLPRLFVIFIENYKFNHRSTLPRSGIRITQ